MKLKDIPIFKILIIIILTCFLYLYYEQRDIGRYKAIDTQLLDTKTGEVRVRSQTGSQEYYYYWKKLIKPISK